MSRLPSAAQSLPARGYPPKRMNPLKTLRTSESHCNMCQHTGKSTNSSSQTMDLNDEYFLKDAIIRFPRDSAKDRGKKGAGGGGSVKLEEPYNEHATQTDSQPADLDAGGAHHLSSKLIDLTLGHDEKETIPLLAHETGMRDEGRRSRQPHRMGEVPKYLIQRKKDLAHAQTMVNEAPAGHYLLSEEERLEALQLAQARYDQLIGQLNGLSITSQTFRTRNKKIDIEKELQSLDNTLKIFSRNKVFVNLGE